MGTTMTAGTTEMVMDPNTEATARYPLGRLPPRHVRHPRRPRQGPPHRRPRAAECPRLRTNAAPATIIDQTASGVSVTVLNCARAASGEALGLAPRQAGLRRSRMPR